MADTSDIMEALRAGTKPIHTQTEVTSPLIPLMRGALAEPDAQQAYVAVLKNTLSFVRPFERAVRENPYIDAGNPALAERLDKAGLIERDLEKLGVSRQEIDAIPDSQHIPAFDSAEAVLGALYVMEGATRGGVHITRILQQRYDWEVLKSPNSINPYGDKSDRAWEEFGAFVRERAKGLEPEKIVSAAVATFEAFGAHFAEGQSSAPFHADAISKRRAGYLGQ